MQIILTHYFIKYIRKTTNLAQMHFMGFKNIHALFGI